MKKRDSQLNMTQNELMEVKMKSLKKLEDPNLTSDETQEIKNLINLIDKALEELSKPSTSTASFLYVWVITMFKPLIIPIGASPLNALLKVW